MTAIDMARVVAREDIAEVLVNAAQQHLTTHTIDTLLSTMTSSSDTKIITGHSTAQPTLAHSEQPVLQHPPSISAETTSSAGETTVTLHKQSPSIVTTHTDTQATKNGARLLEVTYLLHYHYSSYTLGNLARHFLHVHSSSSQN